MESELLVRAVFEANPFSESSKHIDERRSDFELAQYSTKRFMGNGESSPRPFLGYQTGIGWWSAASFAPYGRHLQNPRRRLTLSLVIVQK